MSVYKKVSKRTIDLLPVLKARFPSIEDDIIISVATVNNNSLIKTTEALSEISGVPFDRAIKQGLSKRHKRKRRSNSKELKIDRRGVPWSKLPMPDPPRREQPPPSSDILSEEEFDKWLKEQLELVELEKKLKQQPEESQQVEEYISSGADNCQDSSTTTTSSPSSDDSFFSWDEDTKNWPKLETSDDLFSEVVIIPREGGKTAVVDMHIDEEDPPVVEPFPLLNPEENSINCNENTESALIGSFELSYPQEDPLFADVDFNSFELMQDSFSNIPACGYVQLFEPVFEEPVVTEIASSEPVVEEKEGEKLVDRSDKIAVKLIFDVSSTMYRFRVSRASFNFGDLKKSYF